MRQVKIGLALGSGAAKWWAHIGVINGLEKIGIKIGIKIDVIGGCSVGAMVGAAYASNYLGAMEFWVRSFSYWNVLRLMDFSWRRGGLLRGERVFNAIANLIKINSFSECLPKFGVVATNLTTGRELWLIEGDINQAIRASCSIPGLLSPVWFNGQWLVDGAIVNPVPISLTRMMGADIVIAVDLQQDAHLISQGLLSDEMVPDDYQPEVLLTWRQRLHEKLTRAAIHKSNTTPSAMEIMSASIQVLENSLKYKLMIAEPADILIQPHCPQISMLDFHRAEETIAAGQLALEQRQEELLSLIKKKRETL